MADALNTYAAFLEAELAWLAQALQRRLDAYFATPSTSPALPGEALPAPDLAALPPPMADLLAGLEDDDRLILALALAPHYRPQLLDVLWTRNEATQRGFSEFGGLQGPQSGCFLPTGETACFLLAGDNLARRLSVARRLGAEGSLTAADLASLAPAAADESQLAGALQASPRVLDLIAGNSEAPHAGGERFPAQQVTTGLDWSDLVLPATTLAQLEEIRDWLRHGHTLLHDWGMAARLRPGYTALFHGPPGTGKTLSACLLGKLCGREVYRIDIAMVVSKYIGETEKNLARVFDQAESRGWILFFDEADALFGQRTRVESSHDRYANQEVSFLLQRIEDFSGVVILSSNLKSNIDDAFIRRFQSVVAFALPRPPDRLRLWQEAMPARATLGAGLDLKRLAERHEVAGGTIMNVVRYAALKCLVRGETVIRAEDVDDGIRRELLKEGRAF